jgi:hypothetical protein
VSLLMAGGDQVAFDRGKIFPRAFSKHINAVLGWDSAAGPPDWAANGNRYGDEWVEEPIHAMGCEPIDPEELWKVRVAVLERLENEGLNPGGKLSPRDRNIWDFVVGQALFELIPFAEHEKFDDDVWTYLTIYLFWDFPGWRFPGRTQTANKASDENDPPANEDESVEKSKPDDRVKGGLRNVLFRAWFRVHVLRDDLDDDLGEDIIDNVFGRPSISHNHELARAIIRTLNRNEPSKVPGRHLVFREFMKSIRRRTATINFTAMGESLLASELDKLWAKANHTIGSRPAKPK